MTIESPMCFSVMTQGEAMLSPMAYAELHKLVGDFRSRGNTSEVAKPLFRKAEESPATASIGGLPSGFHYADEAGYHNEGYPPASS